VKIRIEVVYALAHAQTTMELELEQGSRVSDALEASRLREQLGELSSHRVGIWGEPASLDTPLIQGDRVEIYRELTADPKQARRRRAGRENAARKRR
jgi:putative ubiquitin-RnfH superfamily antitoxin RatB of RatAB toxin-antitoxin module